MAEPRKLRARDLLAYPAKGRRIVALTAYDALFGRLADEAGADLILVGDSLGNVVLGYPNTLRVTLEQSLHHTAAVVRGVKRALVVGDMPFLTYTVNADEALRNAGRYLQEAGADAVKIEGGQRLAPLVERLVQSGIPVLGHIGIMPQQVAVEGGYKVHGRRPEEAAELLADALALEAAGAFGVVLEGVVMDQARFITDRLKIPTIGIGAGPHCDGQIQVTHDLLGLFEDFVPKHTKHYAQLAGEIRRVITDYGEDVREDRFPTAAHGFE